jgi:hypothetical protein
LDFGRCVVIPVLFIAFGAIIIGFSAIRIQRLDSQFYLHLKDKYPEYMERKIEEGFMGLDRDKHWSLRGVILTGIGLELRDEHLEVLRALAKKYMIAFLFGFLIVILTIILGSQAS